MSKGIFDDSVDGDEGSPSRTFIPWRSGSDRLANSEAAAIAGNEDLEADGKKKEHDRHQLFRDHANIAALLILWSVVGLTLLGMALFCINLLLPECHQWLSLASQEKIQTLLAAALLSSAMTGYVNRRMS